MYNTVLYQKLISLLATVEIDWFASEQKIDLLIL